jgi:hypothetical protein
MVMLVGNNVIKRDLKRTMRPGNNQDQLAGAGTVVPAVLVRVPAKIRNVKDG